MLSNSGVGTGAGLALGAGVGAGTELVVSAGVDVETNVWWVAGGLRAACSQG